MISTPLGRFGTRFGGAVRGKPADSDSVARGVEDLAVAVGNPKRLGDRLYYAHMFHPVGQAVVLYGKSEGFVEQRSGE